MNSLETKKKIRSSVRRAEREALVKMGRESSRWYSLHMGVCPECGGKLKDTNTWYDTILLRDRQKCTECGSSYLQKYMED